MSHNYLYINKIPCGCIIFCETSGLGGMSGAGAKGTMAYGFIGANLLLQQEEDSEMYQKTKTALGVKRLQYRIEDRTSQFDKHSDFHASWFIGEQQMKTQ